MKDYQLINYPNSKHIVLEFKITQKNFLELNYIIKTHKNDMIEIPMMETIRKVHRVSGVYLCIKKHETKMIIFPTPMPQYIILSKSLSIKVLMHE